MNAFTHENPPDKLIVTNSTRDATSMFNNKAFLDFINKISRRIDNERNVIKKRESTKEFSNLALVILECTYLRSP